MDHSKHFIVVAWDVYSVFYTQSYKLRGKNTELVEIFQQSSVNSVQFLETHEIPHIIKHITNKKLTKIDSKISLGWAFFHFTLTGFNVFCNWFQSFRISSHIGHPNNYQVDSATLAKDCLLTMQIIRFQQDNPSIKHPILHKQLIFTG